MDGSKNLLEVAMRYCRAVPRAPGQGWLGKTIQNTENRVMDSSKEMDFLNIYV